MTLSPSFSRLPDDALLWIYVADRTLNDTEQTQIAQTLDSFLASWQSHGRKVEGAYQLMDNRVLLVAGEVPQGDLSGCGIDASVRILKEIASSSGFTWLPALHIIFRDSSGVIQFLPRPIFRKQVREGHITAETPVFDLSLHTLGALRTQGLERPAGTSWHARVFRIPVPAG